MVSPSQVVCVGVWIIGLPLLELVPHVISLLDTIISKISYIIKNKLITHITHHMILLTLELCRDCIGFVCRSRIGLEYKNYLIE